jgi:probable HAF family extracellular repeat protein
LFLEQLEDRCLLSYTITDLGTLGGLSSNANGLSPSGLVTGDSLTAAGVRHAFLWDPVNGMRDLGTLGGNQSHGFGVNDAGLVVGLSDTTNDPRSFHAFLYDGSLMNDLGTFGGGSSAAFGINASGQAAGFADNTAPRNRAFFYDGFTLTNLGTLGGRYSRAHAINDSGLIAGDSGIRPGANLPSHALLWDQTNGLRDIGSLGGAETQSFGINANGQVVGLGETDPDVFHAFLYDGTMHDLGTLGGMRSQAYGINASGQVVGYSYTASGDSHAFLYDGTMHDLNDFIPPDSGWTLYAAHGINDAGQLVVDGVSPNGSHALLLTPDDGGGAGGSGNSASRGPAFVSAILLAPSKQDAVSGLPLVSVSQRADDVQGETAAPTESSRVSPSPVAEQQVRDTLFVRHENQSQWVELTDALCEAISE